MSHFHGKNKKKSPGDKGALKIMPSKAVYKQRRREENAKWPGHLNLIGPHSLPPPGIFPRMRTEKTVEKKQFVVVVLT